MGVNTAKNVCQKFALAYYVPLYNCKYSHKGTLMDCSVRRGRLNTISKHNTHKTRYVEYLMNLCWANDVGVNTTFYHTCTCRINPFSYQVIA